MAFTETFHLIDSPPKELRLTFIPQLFCMPNISSRVGSPVGKAIFFFKKKKDKCISSTYRNKFTTPRFNCFHPPPTRVYEFKISRYSYDGKWNKQKRKREGKSHLPKPYLKAFIVSLFLSRLYESTRPRHMSLSDHLQPLSYSQLFVTKSCTSSIPSPPLFHYNPNPEDFHLSFSLSMQT